MFIAYNFIFHQHFSWKKKTTQVMLEPVVMQIPALQGNRSAMPIFCICLCITELIQVIYAFILKIISKQLKIFIATCINVNSKY